MRRIARALVALALAACVIPLAGCPLGIGNVLDGIGTTREAEALWPLAEDAEPLEEVLPDPDMRAEALRVLSSERPWRLSGTDPADGDDLIEGLPNELDEEDLFETLFGKRQWTEALDIIAEGSGFSVSYELSDYVPEGYTRLEAFVSGANDDRHPTTLKFVIILRDADATCVLASMTSIAVDGRYTV